MDKFEKDIDNSREISKDAIYKVVLLSSAIVGFSISLFSVTSFQKSLELSQIKLSWDFFLAVIIFGTFLILADGRIKYALAWKSNQTSIWLHTLKDYTIKHRIVAFLITIITLIYPGNLIYNLVYHDEKERTFKQIVNGMVVHQIGRFRHMLVLLENFTFVCFVIALVFLVNSFTP